LKVVYIPVKDILLTYIVNLLENGLVSNAECARSMRVPHEDLKPIFKLIYYIVAKTTVVKQLLS